MVLVCCVVVGLGCVVGRVIMMSKLAAFTVLGAFRPTNREMLVKNVLWCGGGVLCLG